MFSRLHQFKQNNTVPWMRTRLCHIFTIWVAGAVWIYGTTHMWVTDVQRVKIKHFRSIQMLLFYLFYASKSQVGKLGLYYYNTHGNCKNNSAFYSFHFIIYHY